MSETIPGYGPLPEPPPIDAAMLRSRIAMYLHAGCGDPSARRLLEEAAVALLQIDTKMQVLRMERMLTAFIQRVEPVLKTVEGCISDGK